MFEIDKNFNITIPRGDTAAFEITFTGDYPQAGDRVVMALKTNPRQPAELWAKEVTEFEPADDPETEGTKVRFDIRVEDTAQLAFGTYCWDMRIFYADGNVTTPIDVKKFVITEVTTNDRERP